MKKHALTRRGALAAGLAAAALIRLPGRAWSSSLVADACTLVPEQALGPYYIADQLLRSDITEGRPGVALDLRFLVLDVRTCRPLPGAAVDIWHCDALGQYSGDSLTFLRGIQLADTEGVARFRTIYPGVYPGRTNHIHFKVRVEGAASGESYRGGHVSHTGQLFFPETTTIGVMQAAPYAEQRAHRTTQAEDDIFQRQDGSATVARLEAQQSGFVATLVAAVDPTAQPDAA